MNWTARREFWTPQSEDARDDGDFDYARIIHSASFRRLQGKTQILNLGDSDFYRTRLTHSLEVAQIAGGLTKQLQKNFSGQPVCENLPSRSMVQAIGCAHDLGHPPFGHGGEVALNYCMRNDGGFEGNGQTLRILARLENFSKNAGANLCRRTYLGILKYPVSYSKVRNENFFPSLLESPTTIKLLDVKTCAPPKCFMGSESDVVSWILQELPDSERNEFQNFETRSNGHAKAKHKSLDCSIMDVADDIAYGVHDLEDAIALGLVTKDDFGPDLRTGCASFLDFLKYKYPKETENDVFSKVVEKLFGSSSERKHYINRILNHLITSIDIEEDIKFQDPLLRYRAKLPSGENTFLNTLKKLVVEKVIKSPEVQHLEFKGQSMVVSVFEAIASDPKRLLPTDARKRYMESGESLRVLCDFVAGMTDSYLLRTYERLFSPRMGTVFDKL